MKKTELLSILSTFLSLSFLSLAGWNLHTAYLTTTEREIVKPPAYTRVSDHEKKEGAFREEFQQLKSSNQDVALLFSFPGVTHEAVVSTPHDQNEYLHLNLAKEYDPYGTLLLGSYSKGTLESNEKTGFGNTLIYGHNTDNNSKFGHLDEYLTNEALEKSSVIMVYDGVKLRYYKPSFVLNILDGQEFVLQKEFSSEKEMVDYNSSMKARAFAKNSLSDSKRPVLYLQTCVAIYGDERYVFGCVEVDEKGRVV